LRTNTFHHAKVIDESIRARLASIIGLIPKIWRIACYTSIF